MTKENSNRKQFDEDQKLLIEKLRKEKHSVHSIASILMVGQERVRRYLKENNLEVYQESRSNRMTMAADIKIIEVDFPDFSQAACKKYPTTQFFPEFENNSRLAKVKHEQIVRQSINICMGCEIQETCLEYALKAEPYGIWGGTTDIERVYLRNKLNIECLRDVAMNRFGRKTRLSFMSPSMAPYYDEHYQKSKAVAKRLLKNA